MAAESAVSGLLIGARMGLSFLCGGLIARALGAEGRGEVVFLVSWAAVIAMFGAAGVVPATSRARRALPDGSPMRSVLWVTTLRVVVLGLIALGGRAIFAGRAGDLEPAVVALLGGLALVTALQPVVAGVAAAAGRSVFVSSLYAAGTACLASAIWVLGRSVELHTTSVLAIWLASSGAGVLVVVLRLRDGRPTVPLAALLRWSTQAGWGELALATAWRVDNLLIGTLLGFTDLARYSAAVAVAEVNLALLAGVRMAMLRVPDLDPRRAVRVSLRLTLILAAPIVIAVGAIGPHLVEWMFGPEFGGLRPILLTLVPGTIALGLCHVWVDLLSGAGRTRVVTTAGVTALVINAAGNAVLLPRWGISGAATAATLAYGSAAVVLWVGSHPSPSIRRSLEGA